MNKGNAAKVGKFRLKENLKKFTQYMTKIKSNVNKRKIIHQPFLRQAQDKKGSMIFLDFPLGLG